MTTECVHCGYPKRRVWVPGENHPELTKLEWGNYLLLSKCPACDIYWLACFYEPYGSFRYDVPWPFSKEQFLKTNDEDQGKILGQWHENEVRRLAIDLPQTSVDLIRKHYKRSYGYVDLTPTGKDNPVLIN